MKKQIIFVFLYTLFLLTPFTMQESVAAKENIIHYTILMDEESNSVEVKEKAITIIGYLCDQVDEESYEDIIKDNLSYFERVDGWKVKWKENMLIINVNGKKEKLIKGSYEKNQVCFDEVQPKSIIVEWLAGEK